MTYRRTHLHLCTFGAPTSIATIDYAPSHWLAGGRLAGLAKDLQETAATMMSH
jgi:hypothetical protein